MSSTAKVSRRDPGRKSARRSLVKNCVVVERRLWKEVERTGGGDQEERANKKKKRSAQQTLACPSRQASNRFHTKQCSHDSLYYLC